jgi:hypothetical protein
MTILLCVAELAFLQAIEETPLERALAAVSPGALYSRFFSPQPPTKVQANDENIEYFL